MVFFLTVYLPTWMVDFYGTCRFLSFLGGESENNDNNRNKNNKKQWQHWWWRSDKNHRPKNAKRPNITEKSPWTLVVKLDIFPKITKWTSEVFETNTAPPSMKGGYPSIQEIWYLRNHPWSLRNPTNRKPQKLHCFRFANGKRSPSILDSPKKNPPKTSTDQSYNSTTQRSCLGIFGESGVVKHSCSLDKALLMLDFSWGYLTWG